ncbi:hypothetical protein [Dysgonomonas sp. 25]|uniref:hypothetical protein n=1 Tax=Dysgonomonas sp. 25 TaxID=2302933 RepID=UPI0013D7B48D|nr:hypothetical protein [Dysgonomonas sp. 25]
MWEIIDNNGTIHSGSEEEMRLAFDIMTDNEAYSEEEVAQWACGWDGDLRLIQIHAISH